MTVTTEPPRHDNTDFLETEKFSRLARQWWDPHGPLRTLHDINPLRLQYVGHFLDVKGKTVLDVGCGGGIFSEALACKGATVTAIDMSTDALAVARDHAAGRGLEIDYRESTIEALPAVQPAGYDVITCMELLEHVPDPVSVIESCARLLNRGGHAFFSTVNRTAMAWLQVVVGAEYLLHLLPVGTHQYARFIRPSELAGWCERYNLSVDNVRGMRYVPVIRKAFFSRSPDVNYLLHARRN